MIRVGLTGGIGAGKSTVADGFRSAGIPVMDTDEIAREQVATGQPALDEIVERFGTGCLNPDGSLNRAGLAQIIFQSNDARRDLEAILHPRIHRVWQGALDTWAASGSRVGVVVIPLLFEKGYPSDFDAIIAVGCSKATQWNRLRARGWSEVEIQSRNAAQWSMTAKLDAAHRVIWNEGTLHCLDAQLRRLRFRGQALA